MVKKREKPAAEEPTTQTGWGAAISTNPENRQPPAEGDEPEVPHPFPVTGQQPAEDAEWQEADPAAAPVEQPAVKSKGRKPKAKPDAVPATPPTAGGNRDPLVTYVERFERLAEEKATIVEDQKEVLAEAKAAGYDIATLRKVLARRRMDPSARAEMDALIDTYEKALG